MDAYDLLFEMALALVRQLPYMSPTQQARALAALERMYKLSPLPNGDFGLTR